MGKFDAVLKSEILRLAKKVAKKDIAVLSGKVRGFRRTVSVLAKKLSGFERDIRGVIEREKSRKSRLEIPEEEVKSARISPNLVKKLRKRFKLTQGDLALLLGVSKSAVISWESGRSAPKQAAKSGLVALRKLKRRDVNALLADKGKVQKEKKPRKKPRGKKVQKPVEKAAQQ
jgi:DNA-binding transcriptional regulator YiaG